MYTITQRDFRGNIKRELQSYVLGACKLYALYNTKGKSTTTVTDESGTVLYKVEGQGQNLLPKVTVNIAYQAVS